MGTEQRKWTRRAVNTQGFLYASDGWPIGPCQIEDVSVGGAKLAHAIADDIPAKLVLLLSRDGRVRRSCEVAWRGESRLGVRFLERRAQ